MGLSVTFKQLTQVDLAISAWGSQFGKAQNAPRLVQLLDELEPLEHTESLRFLIAEDLDRLLPLGSPTVSKALADHLARRAAPPSSHYADDQLIRRVLYRLRAREVAH